MTTREALKVANRDKLPLWVHAIGTLLLFAAFFVVFWLAFALAAMLQSNQ